MIYRSQGHEIDLANVTRLYPAAVVNAGGEEAPVSLEWARLKAGIVPVVRYVLVFDFDPVGSEVKHRIELCFEREDELIDAMTDVARRFDDVQT